MINLVPQASGLNADGSPDGALLQAMAARKKAQLQGLSGGQQLMQKASSSEPIYNKSLGYAKLIAGGLGGFLEGNEQRTAQEKEQAIAKQGAQALGAQMRALGMREDQIGPAMGLYLSNPVAGAALIKQVSERMFAKPDEQWTQENRPDGLYQRSKTTGKMERIAANPDPLEREGKQLDVDAKKRAAGDVPAPTVQRIKQPDGSEVAVQWDQGRKDWVPLKAPEGGNAVKGPVKLSEAQSKDLVYYNRGIQALDVFEKDAGAYASGADRLAAAVPGGNYVVSEQFQKAQQSGRNFLASILRKDTGAAITKDEEAQYGGIFLPQPGDGQAVLEQKKLARAQALEAIRNGLGTAEVLARAVPQPQQPEGPPIPPEVLQQQSQAAQPPAATPAPPPAEAPPAQPVPSEGGWIDMGGGIRIRERR